MKHEVNWDEANGCVRFKLVGELSPEEAEVVMTQVYSAMEGRQPKLFLIDHTLSPQAISRETRRVIERRGRGSNFDKTAFFGMTNLNRMVARIAVVVMGEGERTKFFVSEAQALAWLRDSD